jgi:ParB-like chromosome segregation protein Spo0J
LPPVKLYKLEEAYFVVDGHHRVSVARYHDVPTVEAAVVEFHPKLPAAPVPLTSKSEEARRRP